MPASIPRGCLVQMRRNQRQPKERPFEQRFVNLRRMARSQSLVQHGLQARIGARLFDHCFEIGDRWPRGVSGSESPRPDFGQVECFLGELHRPRHRRGPTVKFAIDEVRAATEKQTNRRNHSDIIRQAQPRKVVPPPVKKHGEGEPDHSAVARHSPVPDAKDEKRIYQQLSRTIEDHVTKPATHDHA